MGKTPPHLHLVVKTSSMLIVPCSSWRRGVGSIIHVAVYGVESADDSRCNVTLRMDTDRRLTLQLSFSAKCFKEQEKEDGPLWKLGASRRASV